MTLAPEAPATLFELAPVDTSRRAQVTEDAEWLAACGEDPENAARRLGYRDFDTLDRVLRRWDRADLARAFVQNAHRRGVAVSGQPLRAEA